MTSHFKNDVSFEMLREMDFKEIPFLPMGVAMKEGVSEDTIMKLVASHNDIVMMHNFRIKLLNNLKECYLKYLSEMQ